MNSEVSEFSTLVPGAEVSEMNEAKCREWIFKAKLYLWIKRNERMNELTTSTGEKLNSGGDEKIYIIGFLKKSLTLH